MQIEAFVAGNEISRTDSTSAYRDIMNMLQQQKFTEWKNLGSGYVVEKSPYYVY